MAVGRLNIFGVGQRRGRYGEIIREYQLNFNDAGNTFSGTMDEEKLREFLVTKMAIPGTIAERTLEELNVSGKSTLSDLDIPEVELGALGLVQEPSDS